MRYVIAFFVVAIVFGTIALVMSNWLPVWAKSIVVFLAVGLLTPVFKMLK